ncbi:hypothetical protein HK100_001469 [Physocladia obscura]|uniref:Inositol polyphosphate-related phosphatase domain-containing protein n=1 Tax=Physocladia obscura TaxID=109957 RepID=A0AAD5T2S4_9FUNG|nr:hypothetical protein HK100_001469 [Physocladia obscura]
MSATETPTPTLAMTTAVTEEPKRRPPPPPPPRSMRDRLAALALEEQQNQQGSNPVPTSQGPRLTTTQGQGQAQSQPQQPQSPLPPPLPARPSLSPPPTLPIAVPAAVPVPPLLAVGSAPALPARSPGALNSAISGAGISGSANGSIALKPHAVVASGTTSRALPLPASATPHVLSHRGAIRCVAVRNGLLVSAGDRHLRVSDFSASSSSLQSPYYSANTSSSSLPRSSVSSLLMLSQSPAPREVAVLPLATLATDASSDSSKDSQNIAGVSAIAFVPRSSSSLPATAFSPTGIINPAAFVDRVWVAIEKTGEIVALDLAPNNINKSTTVSIVERRIAHSSTVTHILPVSSNSPEIWTLDDQGGLRVWSIPSNTQQQQQQPLSLVLNLTRSLRIGSRQTVAHVVQSRHLWTAGGKILETNDPTSSTSSRTDVTGTAGNFTCFAGGGIDGGLVYSGHDDGKIIVWDATTGSAPRRRYTVSTGIYKITSLITTRRRILWAAHGASGRLCVYDTTTWDAWTCVKEFETASNAAVALLALDVDALRTATNANCNVYSVAYDSGVVKAWDAFLQQDWMDSYMRDREAAYCTYRDVSVFVGTFNINANKPDAMDALPAAQNPFSAWFAPYSGREGPDIVCVGFQELVDLESKKANAKQIFMEAIEITKKVASGGGGSGGDKNSGSISGPSGSGDGSTAAESNRLIYWRDRIVKALVENFPSSTRYRLVECHALFGLFQCVFIRETTLSENNNNSAAVLPGSVQVAQVKTGLGGFHANKGGIATRLVIDDTSFCFVNCHLAAHQTQVSARNTDIVAIRDGLEFSALSNGFGKSFFVFGQGGDGSMVMDHENVFFSGDLNYRIDLPREKVIAAIEKRDWNYLLAKDQLHVQMTTNASFGLRAFTEAPITFAPTFKYDVRSTQYDTSDKKRVPAWCDRILYSNSGGSGGLVVVDGYERGECTMSDHRPVSGRFRVRVKHVDVVAAERERGIAKLAVQEYKEGAGADVLRGK